MGGGGGDKSDNTVRYAPYVEDKHSAFLTEVATHRASIIDGGSPFSSYTAVDADVGFFGTGYALSNFPSLYDIYGKFMPGLDIEALYNQALEDSTNSPEINNLISAESSLLDDELQESYRRLKLGARNINAVMSSSFVMAKKRLEAKKLKLVSKFSAELKYRMIGVATERWRTHLNWNRNVVMDYAQILKLWVSVKMDVDETNMAMTVKNILWPFTVLEYERAALGALQGASNTSSVAGASTASKVISGALGGASTAAMIGGMMAPAEAAAAGGLAAVGGPITLGIGAALGIGTAFL